MKISKNKKRPKLGLFSYNETPLFNYIIHIGFGIGILSALALLYIRYMG